MGFLLWFSIVLRWDDWRRSSTSTTHQQGRRARYPARSVWDQYMAILCRCLMLLILSKMNKACQLIIAYGLTVAKGPTFLPSCLGRAFSGQSLPLPLLPLPGFATPTLPLPLPPATATCHLPRRCCPSSVLSCSFLFTATSTAPSPSIANAPYHTQCPFRFRRLHADCALRVALATECRH